MMCASHPQLHVSHLTLQRINALLTGRYVPLLVLGERR